ncbi:hypothetical protein SPRG_14529 [Saprolegnia parasitica CBS 223.65]|uniref:Uncharacterized protein n=1 Tax=Saprolegnia parasitica (strain CBS 223.65) TaxID=695850 RepID=A0A067C0X9_SAPPC|nr:hypothetical protein SPRG_14529 [Saprolegnia parasitica CBS 223.65]KDO20181.1 hypothetical protein SPRG_14529 [Saprolegnia parasitica CBS 223.65]|eukprot:XP_012209128.1 hypothetical protein SPRG_14529 [Saprolegnia parasitica CBS 223.65]
MASMTPLPRTVSVPLVAAVAGAWYWAHPPSVQWAAFFAAAGFSCIEFSWYATTTEAANGDLAFTPFAATCRPGHTTWAQFWANVLYTPLLLFTYRAWLPSAFLRVVLFPLNIWLLEIVEGYGLMLVFGRNIAWTYNTPDAYFHNNIRTGFAGLWLLLGLALEVVGYTLVDGLGGAAAQVLPIEVAVAGAGLLQAARYYHR